MRPVNPQNINSGQRTETKQSNPEADRIAEKLFGSRLITWKAWKQHHALKVEFSLLWHALTKSNLTWNEFFIVFSNRDAIVNRVKTLMEQTPESNYYYKLNPYSMAFALKDFKFDGISMNDVFRKFYDLNESFDEIVKNGFYSNEKKLKDKFFQEGTESAAKAYMVAMKPLIEELAKVQTINEEFEKAISSFDPFRKLACQFRKIDISSECVQGGELNIDQYVTKIKDLIEMIKNPFRKEVPISHTAEAQSKDTIQTIDEKFKEALDGLDDGSKQRFEKMKTRLAKKDNYINNMKVLINDQINRVRQQAGLKGI